MIYLQSIISFNDLFIKNMAQVNEILIKEVFDEMVKMRPAFAKYLLTDEDEEVVDQRILADLIIKNFPWPIGVELRRLFSGSMRELNRGRLDQLFKTIERTMQFLSFVMVSELYDLVKKNKTEISAEFSSQFANRFLLLSMGNFAWLIRATGTFLQKNNLTEFIPEIDSNFNNKFFDALDFWVPERNEIGHYQINLTDADIQKRCVEYEDKLTFILKSISFLVRYKLVTIKEIKILK